MDSVSMNINEWMNQKQINRCSVVDISDLSYEENRGFPTAILLIRAFPRDSVSELLADGTADISWICRGQDITDDAADGLAEEIQKQGFHALSQSEHSLTCRKEYCKEGQMTPLPHKKIAVLSGIGWIGKNNLLITEDFGCAFSMCTVLTDMPFPSEKGELLPSECGKCDLCVNACPTGALHGSEWHRGQKREDMIEVRDCRMCSKCLVMCKYSIRYAKSGCLKY